VRHQDLLLVCGHIWYAASVAALSSGCRQRRVAAEQRMLRAGPHVVGHADPIIGAGPGCWAQSAVVPQTAACCTRHCRRRVRHLGYCVCEGEPIAGCKPLLPDRHRLGTARPLCHPVAPNAAAGISPDKGTTGTFPTSNQQFMSSYNYVRPSLGMDCAGILKWYAPPAGMRHTSSWDKATTCGIDSMPCAAQSPKFYSERALESVQPYHAGCCKGTRPHHPATKQKNTHASSRTLCA
jgi:hypothetical protein